jgi:hypothetical protein
VLLGVEHLVLDAPLAQQRRDGLGLLHAHGAHEEGWPRSQLGDLLDHRAKLLALGLVDEVVVVLALDGRFVGICTTSSL